MEKITPISEARSHLPEIVDDVREMKRHVIITRGGKAAAVIMSPEEFETLEILADSALVKSLIRAQEDIKRGRLVSHKEVFRGL